MSQTTQSEEKKSNEKCGCNKKIAQLEKDIAELKAEIAVLKAVLKRGR